MTTNRNTSISLHPYLATALKLFLVAFVQLIALAAVSMWQTDYAQGTPMPWYELLRRAVIGVIGLAAGISIASGIWHLRLSTKIPKDKVLALRGRPV